MTNSRVVAHVTTAHPAQDNRIFKKECAALAEAGFDVHLIAVAPHDHRLGGVSIHALPRRAGRLTRMVRGPLDAWAALRRLQPGLVHVHDPELIPLAIAWRLLHRRPAVYDAHEDLPKQVLGKAYLPRFLRQVLGLLAVALETAADRWLDGVVAATPGIAAKYRCGAVLVQNFPWLAAFSEPGELRESTRGIVYIGAINEGRGLSTMLQLARELPAGSTLSLAGPASSADTQLIAQQDAGACRYHGVVAVEEIPELLDSARVGLALLQPLPNYLNSQATKIYEYMAAGRPFIASNFESWVAQLGPHHCGVFVDPGDLHAVRSAVEGLLADTAAARSMGLRGRRAFEDHFVFDREAPRLVQLTRRLTDAHA